MSQEIHDWYENRHLLEPGMVFVDIYGDKVMLDRRVPGDGTKWYVADHNSYYDSWSYEDSTTEPGELDTYLYSEY
jgi:hypothetical protein